MSVLAKIKDSLRKMIVSLKRNPSVIPLVMMMITFVFYSLNLTDISNSTAKVQRSGMGLCEFAIMLLSILSMVCMLNSFPKRKKPNYPMIALMFVMFGVIIFCAIHYSNTLFAAVAEMTAKEGFAWDDTNIFLMNAYNTMNTLVVLMGVTTGLVLLLPVYSKLLRKINTNVDVEDNGDMAQIEISE